MSCDVNKFVITKGVDNTFVFTIKQTGTTLPMTIVNTDTFTAKLEDLGTGTTVLSKALEVVDALSGKVRYIITASETSGLVSEKGDKVDRYYLKPVYKLVIDCKTTNNGNFIAKVCEVYVD